MTELNWDRYAKLGQTRPMDDDEVLVKVDSLTENPPDVLLSITLWPNEGMCLYVCLLMRVCLLLTSTRPTVLNL